MIKLEPTGKLYHDMIFIIWSLLHYYENLLGFYAGASASEDFRCKYFPCGKITKIRATVPIIKEAEHRDVREMRTIFNEYLPLLLQDSDIPPYASENDFAEALYITDVVTDGNSYYQIDILWINSKESYEHMLQNEKNYMERSKSYEYK